MIIDKEFPTHNSKPCCIQCYNKYLAPECAQCLKIISVEESIIANEKTYHRDCFRCFQCNKLIDDSKFHIQNCKPCCIQCFNQYFAPECAQCLKIISVGKSIIFDGKCYHPDCFRCDQCKQILTDSKFQTRNSKPCCIQCSNDYSTLRCSKCSKPIIDRYTTFQGKNFHIQCFVCQKCHRIIESRDKFCSSDFGILCSICAI
jgi:hypothetical protein